MLLQQNGNTLKLVTPISIEECLVEKWTHPIFNLEDGGAKMTTILTIPKSIIDYLAEYNINIGNFITLSVIENTDSGSMYTIVSNSRNVKPATSNNNEIFSNIKSLLAITEKEKTHQVNVTLFRLNTLIKLVIMRINNGLSTNLLYAAM